MARYIATVDLEALATEFGVTTQQVQTFIGAQRANGNINAIYGYINANPGANDADVLANAVPGIDAQTLERILRLLELTNWIAVF